MKKIVCEMCECTEFIKEDGLFVCQECGCKYSVEEAKKLMKEVCGGDEVKQFSDGANEETEDPRENIPVHTPDSPNKISVKVIKVGHEAYAKASSIYLSTLLNEEPRPSFVEGPDGVGHIGAEISVTNVAGKTIKYATVYLIPFNNVGDQVGCTVAGHSSFGINITGPFPVGKTWEGHLDGMWYNRTITYAKIDYVHVIYMDDTEELYKGEEFYNTTSIKDGATSDEKTATLTIRRYYKYVKTPPKITKLNRLICHLSNGEDFELGINELMSIPLKYGTYKIDFEFSGSWWVPSKNLATPEFVVDGNIHIELTPSGQGGYETEIVREST